jgi:hypothetical protein
MDGRTGGRGPQATMVFLGGFYTPDVWKYQQPHDFQAAIS